MQIAILTVDDACAILADYLGSGDDPVWYKGEASSPNDLRYSEIAGRNAARCRIRFYAANRKQPVFGSLRDMIIDRIGVKKTGKRKESYVQAAIVSDFVADVRRLQDVDADRTELRA